MIDYQNPTIEQIESLIPDSIRYKLAGIETTWSRPDNLRLMREWANQIVPKKNFQTNPKEYSLMFDVVWHDDTSPEVYERWEKLCVPMASFVLAFALELTAYSHFLELLIQNLRDNWYYFDAPMQVCKEFCLPEDKE